MRVRRRASLKRLEGKQSGAFAHAAVVLLLASALASATGAAGLVVEYWVLKSTQPQNADPVALGRFISVLAGTLVAALFLWLGQKRMDRGVVVDLHITQLGRAKSRSKKWPRNSMTAFAAVHRHFFPHSLSRADADSCIDLSSQLTSAMESLEAVLSSNRQSSVLITPEGPVPALIGMGASAYLPEEALLVEVLDGKEPSKSGKRSKGQGKSDEGEFLIEIASGDIDKAVTCHSHPHDAVSRAESFGVSVDGKVLSDWWKGSKTEYRSKCILRSRCKRQTKVKTVKLALGAVKKNNISNWTPFENTRLSGSKGVSIRAGALTEGEKPSFAGVTLYSGQSRKNSEGSDLVEVSAAANYFAHVISWTLWRYPNAKVHLTARIPRIVAVAIGAILSARPDWIACDGCDCHSSCEKTSICAKTHKCTGVQTWFPESFASRLNLWGALEPEQGDASGPKLVQFEVFGAGIGSRVASARQQRASVAKGEAGD